MQTRCNERKPEFCRKIKMSREIAAGFGMWMCEDVGKANR
jgi:hypothetical protein